MKKLFYFTIAVLSLSLFSCDKEEHPSLLTPGLKNKGDSVYKTNSAVVNTRKVMVEDYTGHQCGNCPNAAIALKNIETANPNKVVGIAVHAGFFAKVNALYPEDFTTAIGNDWNSSSKGFGIISNPCGLVNRIGYPNGTHIKTFATWAGIVSTELAKSQIAKIDFKTAYFPESRTINTDANVTFLQAYSNPVNITIVLTEDSIIAPQKIYDINGVPYVGPDPNEVDRNPDYEFEHVLRMGVTSSSLGDPLTTAAVSANFSTRFIKRVVGVDAKFNDRHLKAVCFITDANTREVLQVEQLKIR